MHDTTTDSHSVSTIDNPIEEAVFGACCDDRTAAAVNPADDLDAPPTHFTLAVYGLIFLLGALAGLGPLAIDTYLPSFNAIAADLHSNTDAVGRSLSSYFVGLAIGQLIYGPASDRFGRKRPLYIGLVIFAIASVGCALSSSVPMLVALRFVQALGGCAEMVIARAIVRDRFPPRDAIRVFSGLVLVMGVAPIVAPLMGGFLVTYYSWRTIFWVLAAFAIFILGVVAVALPESHAVARRVPLHVGDTFATFGRLLLDRSFMAYTLVASLLSAGLFAYVGGSPFVFLNLYHIPETHFAWFFGPNAAGLIGSSQVNGYLIRKGFTPQRVLTVALIAATVAAGILVFAAATGFGGFWLLYAMLFCTMSSCGYIFPNATVLAMAPHGRQAGNASALLGCLQFGLSGLGGFIVSVVHATSPVPMAVTIFGCVGTALLIRLILSPREPVTSRVAAAALAH